jgi:hypothetical protein
VSSLSNFIPPYLRVKVPALKIPRMLKEILTTLAFCALLFFDEDIPDEEI